MRGPGDIRPTHLGWKQVVWNFFFLKYIDGAVVATSNSMIILPSENQWDQFQRYFHLKYHSTLFSLSPCIPLHRGYCCNIDKVCGLLCMT